MGSSCKFSNEEATEQARARGFEPLEVYPGAMQKWKCRCLRCGNIAAPRLSSIKEGHKCMVCSGKAKVTEGQALQLLSERNLTPLEPFRSSMHPWKCRCLKCGNKIIARVYKLREILKGCRFCYHASTRIPNDEAKAFMISQGFKPLEDYPGSGKKWKCQCLRCYETYTLTYSSIKEGHKCRRCAIGGGFRTGRAAFLYVVKSKELRAAKIGISNTGVARLRQFKRAGWELVMRWQFEDGRVALDYETALLRWLRKERNVR